MFMWDCIKSEGLHLGTCSDRFLFGSCCYHNTTYNDVDIQRPPNSNTSISNHTEISASVSMPSAQLQVSQSASQAPTTTFLQSTSSLTDHLNSLVAQQQPKHKIPANVSHNAFNGQAWREPMNATTLNNGNINRFSYLPYNTNNNNKWPVEHQMASDSSVHAVHQYQSPTLPQQTNITSTSTTTSSPPTNPPTSIQSSLVHHQESQHVSGPVFLPHGATEQYEQPSSIIPQNAVAKPPINAIPLPEQAPPTSQPQRPASSFWFSRPATALANAFLHTFKPFPYLNQNRQRPTYRPYAANGFNKPQQFINRPNTVSHQRPLQTISNSNQRVPGYGASDQVMTSTGNSSSVFTTSESSFSSNSNLFNNHSSSSLGAVNGSALASMLHHQQHNDDNDHHIVNPSFPSTIDRHRPSDKNQFTDQLVADRNQQQQHNLHNHNHYEILNASTSANYPTQNNVSQMATIQNDATFVPSMQYGGLAPIQMVDSSSNTGYQSTGHSATNLSSAQTSFRPVITEPAINSSYMAPNSDSVVALVTSTTYSMNHDQSKPVLQLEHPHNESANYPSYPLISSFASSTMHYPSIESHLSTTNSIDEIHGLSTLTQTITPVDAYIPTQHQGHSGHSGLVNTLVDHLDPNNQQMQPPPSHLSAAPVMTTATMSIGDGSVEGNSPATTTTTTTTTTAAGPSISSLAASHTTMTPSLVLPTAPPKTFIPLNVESNSNNHKKGGTNKEVACGVTALYPQTKVVGGKNAAFGAWPWQVSVRKVSFFGFSSTHRCGGAVISSEWIATAGHCVEDLALQSIRIRVGEYDFGSMSEPFPYIERAARRKVVHPKYNFYTYENDLALVQLDQPIQFPPHVAPICLPPDNIDLLGRNATVTGWGRLNEGGTLPTILQEVRVPIVSNDKCKDMFLSAGRPEYIPDIFLCAGYEEGGRDSCQGDSGGPLQVKGDDGKWFLAGIISWGIGCAEQNLPGVCTRISRFKLWIQSTMSSS